MCTISNDHYSTLILAEAKIQTLEMSLRSILEFLEIF